MPSSAEASELVDLAKQVQLLPAGDLSEQRLTELAYRDDSEELGSVQKFADAERKRRQKREMMDVLAEHVRARGPIKIDS